MSASSSTSTLTQNQSQLREREIPTTGILGANADPTESTPLLSRPEENGEEWETAVIEDVNKTTMFWEEMRTIPRYALPVFGAQFLWYSMVFVPVIAMGHVSTEALAASSLASMTASVTGFSMIQGLASALDTVLPSAWTSPRPQLVGLWSQRMGVVIAIALLPIYLMWFNAETILLSLKQDPEIARLAAQYLRWLSLGLPAFTFNCISRRYFQSQGLFSVQTQITFLVAPINALLVYALVLGPEPIRLGFIGAPIATSIAYGLIALASLIYGVYFVPHKAWHPLSRKMFTNLWLMTTLGLAGIAQTASKWWAWELVTLAASFLGPVALASQSIMFTSTAMTFQASFSLANATSVRVGNLLGEKKPTRAGIAANASLLLALILSCFLSALYLIFRRSWAYMFNDDPEVVQLVASVIPLIALFQILDGNSAITAGIMRCKGQQFIGALLNISAYYIIGLPLGAWLAFRWNLGLHGLWIGITAAYIHYSVIGTILCVKTDWNWEMVKVAKRIAKEERLRKIELADEENSSLA